MKNFCLKRWLIVLFVLLLWFPFSVRAMPKKERVMKNSNLPSLPVYSSKALQLSALVQAATTHNPTLVRLRRMVYMYKQKEKQAGAWPDLQVGVQASNFPLPTFNPTLTAMSGIQYTISQRFPILRRLDLQRKMTQFTTAMFQEDVREKTVWIHYQIKAAVSWLSYFREALHTEKELYRVMSQAAEVARTKYSVGKASQQNYLQAWTAQAQIQNRMLMLLAKERIKRHQLARLLGATSLIGNAPPLRDQAFSVTRKKLLSLAVKQRGVVKRWRIFAAQSRTLLNLARVKYWPDVSVQLGVRQRFPNPLDQGAPFLTLGVKLALPTWGNYARNGLVKEAMARHQLAASRLQEVTTQIREDIRVTTTLIHHYNKRIAVFRTQVIPLAKQTYHSALASYQVDRVDFLTLLSNLRTLYKEKLKLKRLRTLRAISIARLAAIKG